MPAEAMRPAAAQIQGWREVLWQRREGLAALLFAAVSVQYAVAAVSLAARAPLWMDEVLAVWTARLVSPAAIWRALAGGAEFSPPLYDMLLGSLQAVGLSSALAMRFPSIIAAYVAALAVGAMAGRRGGRIAAALAAAAMLSSGLFPFAVQARPYALVVATFALALLVAERADGGRLSPSRRALLAVLLVVLVGLHFYAVLLVATLLLMEWWRARAAKRPVSSDVAAACALASASLFAWWPILMAARRYAGADAAAPGYYARPTLAALAQSYAAMTGWLILPLAVVLIAVLARRPNRLPAPPIAALVLLFLPIVVFVFALAVSHSFADRYAITGVLGLVLLLVAAVSWLGDWKEPAALILLGVMPLGNVWRSGGEITKPDRLEALAVVNAAPADMPIVTGSGLRFLEILENAPPSVAHRLVFVDVPGARSPDPTNRNQVLRWSALNPAIQVMNAHALLCGGRSFLLFAQPIGGGADPLPAWLAAQGLPAPAPTADATVIMERPRRCDPR